MTETVGTGQIVSPAAGEPEAETVGTTVGTVVPTVSPGHCSDHPELLVADKPGWNHGPLPATRCPDPAHDPYTCRRCRWCGGRLVPEGVPPWQTSDRREYCSSNHRLQAFRARARASA